MAQVRLRLPGTGGEGPSEGGSQDRPAATACRTAAGFPDRTLIDMVRRRPRTEAEFAEVNGVGAAKLKEFAVPFLAAIAAAPAAGDGGGTPHEGAP